MTKVAIYRICSGLSELGVVAAIVWAFGMGFIMFKLIDKTAGLRVSAED